MDLCDFHSLKFYFEIQTHVQTQRIKLKVNTIAILGGRNVVEQILKGDSGVAEGKTFVERLSLLVGKAKLLGELNRIEAKLPHVREVELYGYKE